MKTKEDHEKIFNIHATRLTQQQNKHVAEVKKQLEDMHEFIAAEVKRQVSEQLVLVADTIQRIEMQLRKHFGT